MLSQPSLYRCATEGIDGASEQMKVRVHFFAQLHDLVGIREQDVELLEGAAIRDLLEEIYTQLPALRAHDKSILIGAGVEFVDRNYKLRPGEEISIMPPVQGG
jgi:molybdopterin converting factor small subunit